MSSFSPTSRNRTGSPPAQKPPMNLNTIPPTTTSTQTINPLAAQLGNGTTSTAFGPSTMLLDPNSTATMNGGISPALVQSIKQSPSTTPPPPSGPPVVEQKPTPGGAGAGSPPADHGHDDDEEGGSGSAQSKNKGAPRVPAFLNKLFSMISDPATDSLIYWSEDGKSFFIPNSQDFGRQLLPQFFKHANFTSFVRQLNMYGFKKVPHLQSGVLNSFPSPATELWEFTNSKFERGHPERLIEITRKKSAKEMAAEHAKSGDGGAAGEDDATSKELSVLDSSAMSRVMSMIYNMQNELNTLRATNEALWTRDLLREEQQRKDRQKLDQVMTFLSSRFSDMNFMLEDGDAGAGPSRPRLGKSRMIGDGIRGTEDNMDIDDWPKPSPRLNRHQSSRARHISSSSSSSPSRRFVNLDASPEEKSESNFNSESSSPEHVSTSQMKLFPSLGRKDIGNKPAASSSSNALTTYQPPPSSLDLGQDILNVPLGAFLASPAGAQMLAAIGHNAGQLNSGGGGGSGTTAQVTEPTPTPPSGDSSAKLTPVAPPSPLNPIGMDLGASSVGSDENDSAWLERFLQDQKPAKAEDNVLSEDQLEALLTQCGVPVSGGGGGGGSEVPSADFNPYLGGDSGVGDLDQVFDFDAGGANAIAMDDGGLDAPSSKKRKTDQREQ